MKKTLLALFLVLALLTSTVCAYTVQDNNTADALNDLGLFQGMGGTKGYALDESLTRGQGITLLVRMIGKEEATNSTYTNSFTDASWAAPYIGYAFANGITNGMSETKFGTDVPMTDYMFLTLTLRALGYKDSGANAQFVWNNPYALAKEVGLITSTSADSHFTRGEAIMIFWNAMEADLVGKNMTLSQSLIQQGVFTAAEYAEAQDIQKNGRQENQGQPVQPDPQPPAVDPEPADTLTYEEYQALSGAEQMAYMESFPSVQDFFAWYNEAKAKYDAEQDRIEIGGDGNIDLDDIINGKN